MKCFEYLMTKFRLQSLLLRQAIVSMNTIEMITINFFCCSRTCNSSKSFVSLIYLGNFTHRLVLFTMWTAHKNIIRTAFIFLNQNSIWKGTWLRWNLADSEWLMQLPRPIGSLVMLICLNLNKFKDVIILIQCQ